MGAACNFRGGRGGVSSRPSSPERIKSRFSHYNYCFYYHDSKRKSRQIGKRPQGLRIRRRRRLRLSGIERVRGAAVEDSKKKKNKKPATTTTTMIIIGRANFYPGVHIIIIIVVVVCCYYMCCTIRPRSARLKFDRKSSA